MEGLLKNPARVRGYARFSTNLQDKVSITDQMHQCGKEAPKKNMVLLPGPFTDEGITGTTTFGRQGIMALLAAVKKKPRDFDGIIVDETNRLARNLADLLKICDTIVYHGAFIYFVGQKLDSRDPHFRDLLITYGQRDEAMSRTLAYEVHRGQEGRVRDGLIPGGYCFGYDHETVTDSTRTRRGQEVVIGRRAVVNKKDAVIIRRIFELRAAGNGRQKIAKILNREGVPLPNPRVDCKLPKWTPTRIKRILDNRRYLGWIPYNHTHQKRDPEGGRKGTQHVPQTEWADTHVPDLRIISDDLWTKAHSYTEAVTRPAGLLGGWKRGDSIFSSVLRCTSCPSGSIVIVQKQGRPGKPQKSLYGCGNHFRTGSCPNGVTIERNYLEHELLTAITDRLSAPDLARHMLAGFKSELERDLRQRLQEREEIQATVPELLEEKRRVEGAIRNLLTLAEGCDRAQLGPIRERLNQNQTRLQAIDGLLQQPELGLPEIPEREIIAFLNEKRANLVELLLKDRATAQFAVHKYIQRLEVTPQEDGSICVEGRVKLFDRTDVEPHPDFGRKAGSSTFMDASASTTWQIHVCLNLRPPKRFLGPRIECDPPCPVCILVGIKQEEEKQFKYTNRYKLIDCFDLAPPGVPSLAEYCAKKNPLLPNERFLVVSAWIQRYAGLPHFTASHLYTCFVALGWKTQKYMVQLPRLNPALYESPGYGKWRLKEAGLIAASNLNSETGNEPDSQQGQVPPSATATAVFSGAGASPNLS